MKSSKLLSWKVFIGPKIVQSADNKDGIYCFCYFSEDYKYHMTIDGHATVIFIVVIILRILIKLSIFNFFKPHYWLFFCG